LRIFLSFLLIWSLGLKAFAQESSAAALLEALAGRTPGSMLSEMRGDPDAFLEEAAGVILGFGGRDGIDAPGLEDAVAASRAQVRAREIRRLLQADLNNDLAIDRHERDVAIATASATMRGRLMNWHLTADRSGDGTVSWSELRGFAQDVSVKVLSEDRAAAIRALMVFDLDGNGRVTVAELRMALDLLGKPA
jgi:hypothetical protein